MPKTKFRATDGLAVLGELVRLTFPPAGRREIAEQGLALISRTIAAEAGVLLLRDSPSTSARAEAIWGEGDHESLEHFGRHEADTVLDEWGILSCSDIGEMVFNLIEVGVFGKTAHDRKEDFMDVYDFDEAFRKPFLPKDAARAEVVAKVGGGASGSFEPESLA